MEQDQGLIIERVLAYGDQNEVRWLLTTFGAAVAGWLAQSGAGRLPRRRYNLWCTLFDVKPVGRLRTGRQPIWPY